MPLFYCWSKLQAVPMLQPNYLPTDLSPVFQATQGRPQGREVAVGPGAWGCVWPGVQISGPQAPVLCSHPEEAAWPWASP